MPTFEYRTFRGGVRQSGSVEAESMAAAAAQVRRSGGVVLDLRPAPAGRAAREAEDGGALERALGFVLVSRGQTELLLRQLATLLTAGVPILTAFQAVRRQAPGALARVIDRVSRKVRQGHPLQRAFREEAPFVGPVPLGLIGVGEANGTLDEMLLYAAELMEKARNVRKQIVQAFTYPGIVVLGAIGVSYYMVSVVFPQVMTFIEKQGRNVPLPMPTRVLLVVNDFMMAYGVLVLAAPFAAVGLFLLARRLPSTGLRVDEALLRLPLLGPALRDHANAMWCRTLGALLHSGIDVVTALELVRGTLGNQYYRAQFDQVKAVVRQGRSVTQGLESTALGRLCPLSLTMVSVSEETGGMDNSLLHVAADAEDRLTRRVAFLGRIVEPAIFVVVGGLVGFVYFAFFMAMLAVTRSAH